jgi:CRISPR-associated protein (Cas_Cmr5).
MSKYQTQTQKDLAHVAGRVKEVERESWAKIYGGLCHSFPVLVKTAGLAQALEYHRSKASSESAENGSDRHQAHARLVADVRALLPDFNAETASLSEYMRATRRVLAAWVFYKRFAVSMLKAEGANDAQD